MAKSTSGKTQASGRSEVETASTDQENSEASESRSDVASADSHSSEAETLAPDQSGAIPDEVVQLAMQYAGPLPPPKMLNQYNDALPDGAHRIVASWEDESVHRRKLQNRGQLIAAGLGVAAIVAAVVCALSGQPWVGGSIIGFTMVAMGATGAVGQILNISRKR